MNFSEQQQEQLARTLSETARIHGSAGRAHVDWLAVAIAARRWVLNNDPTIDGLRLAVKITEDDLDAAVARAERAETALRSIHDLTAWSPLVIARQVRFLAAAVLSPPDEEE